METRAETTLPRTAPLPLKVAAVGLGWVTTHRHIPAMAESGRFRLVGVVDAEPKRAESVARKLGRVRFACADRLAAVPWLDEVDAVTVGTSPDSHFAIVKEALESGKHVITEKPFALKPEEGEELVGIAASRGLVVAVVHNFQFASSTRRLLADIRSGRMGAVKAIVARQLSNPRRRLPPWYDRLPMGLFYDESPHFLYLVSALAPGPLSLLSCSSFPSTIGMVTPASVGIRYACDGGSRGKLPVSIDMSFEAPVSEWHVTVLGEKFLGDIDIFRDIYVRLPNDGEHSTAKVFRTSALAAWQHLSQHFTSGIRHLRGKLRYGNDEVFRRFADAVNAGRQPEGIDGEAAVRVLRMQHAVLRSCGAGKT